jgi:hypothetical protein
MITQIFISATVVEMPVRVDQELDRLRPQIADRFLDFWGKRRELVVNQDCTVFAIGHADIATCAEQHRDTGRQLFSLDLDF